MDYWFNVGIRVLLFGPNLQDQLSYAMEKDRRGTAEVYQLYFSLILGLAGATSPQLQVRAASIAQLTYSVETCYAEHLASN